MRAGAGGRRSTALLQLPGAYDAGAIAALFDVSHAWDDEPPRRGRLFCWMLLLGGFARNPHAARAVTWPGVTWITIPVMGGWWMLD